MRELARIEVGARDAVALQPRVEREVACEPAEGAADGTGRRAHARAGDPRDRHPGPGERARQRLVLERGPGLEAADAPVGVDGQRDRGAAEVGVRGARECREAPRQPGRAAGRRRLAQAVDDDLAADGVRTGVGGGEQRRQPARLGLGVGVGGDDQAVRAPGGLQARDGEVHGGAARGAHARGGPVGDVQHQVARRGPRPLAGGVGAAVEDEHDLVAAGRDALLLAQGADAAPDELLLVARGDGDDGAQRGHRSSSSACAAA